MSESITVTGMSCTGCEAAVENAVADVDGVESVDADHTEDTVIVAGSADRAAICAAIEDAGYEPA